MQIETTEFEELIERNEFAIAYEQTKSMTEKEIIEELEVLAYNAEHSDDTVDFLAFSFAYRYKLLINDIKWNFILMRLIETSYMYFKGMPDIVLECACRLLELDNSHLRALQAIVDCYEHYISHCSDELYEKTKKRMDELGYTMTS